MPTSALDTDFHAGRGQNADCNNLFKKNHLRGRFLIRFRSPPNSFFKISKVELPGACYRKIPKSVLKKENWFDLTIETSIDF